MFYHITFFAFLPACGRAASCPTGVHMTKRGLRVIIWKVWQCRGLFRGILRTINTATSYLIQETHIPKKAEVMKDMKPTPRSGWKLIFTLALLVMTALLSLSCSKLSDSALEEGLVPDAVSQFYDNKGKVVYTTASAEHRIPVKFEQIPKHHHIFPVHSAV